MVMVVWRHGSMAAWRHCGMVAKQHCSMMTWRHGGMAARQHVGIVAWRHGIIAAWQHSGTTALRHVGMVSGSQTQNWPPYDVRKLTQLMPACAFPNTELASLPPRAPEAFERFPDLTSYASMHCGLTGGWVQNLKAAYLPYFLQCAMVGL